MCSPLPHQECPGVPCADPTTVCSTLSPCSGLLIYPEGPLSLERSPEQMSRVFSPFYNLLMKIRYVGSSVGGSNVGVTCGHTVSFLQGSAAGAVSRGAVPAGEEPLCS